MNHISEVAFKEWLVTEGIAIPVYTGLTGEEVDGDEQRVHCYCGDSTHVAGNLYTANMAIILSTPPHSNAGDSAVLSLADHRSVLSTLRTLVEDNDQTSLTAVYAAETPYRFAGSWLGGEDEMLDDNEWVTKINMTIGIDISG
jgi:hypothetical protein